MFLPMWVLNSQNINQALFGNWIGLGKVDWGWGETGSVTYTDNGATITVVQGSQTNNTPTPTVPLTGAAAFPLWTQTTSQIVQNGWKPV
jgi:hypothetical protein